MDESNPSDDALAEMLSLTVTVNEWGTYYRNHLGQTHRIHGPAVMYKDGTRGWFQDGQRHRTDGPAWVWGDGEFEWYLNGVELTEEQFNERIRSV